MGFNSGFKGLKKGLLKGAHYRTEAEPQGAQNALFITSYSAGIS